MFWFTILGTVGVWGWAVLYFQPRFWDFLWAELELDECIPLDERCYAQPLNGNTRKYDCGHAGAVSFRLFFYGVIRESNLESDDCPECILAAMQEQIIRCAACGGPILVGDPVGKRCSTNIGIRSDIAVPIDDYTSICCVSDNVGCGSIPIGTWGGDGIL